MSRIFIFICITLFLGCRNSNEDSVISKIDKQFKLSLSSVTNSSAIKSKVYMVIPRAGCSACISGAEHFMLTALGDQKKYRFIHFILTDFDSKKILKARFGDVMNSHNLIIDQDNVFNSNKSLTSIYPTIYFFDEKQKLTHVSSMSPKEDGLAEVISYIN